MSSAAIVGLLGPPRSNDGTREAKEMVHMHLPTISRLLEAHRTDEIGNVVAEMCKDDVADKEDAFCRLIDTTLNAHMQASALYLLNAAQNRGLLLPQELKERTLQDLVAADGDIKTMLRAINRFKVPVRLNAFEVSHLLHRAQVDRNVGLANEIMLTGVKYDWPVPLSWILTMVEWNSHEADAVMAKRMWDYLPKDIWHQGLEATLAKLLRALVSQRRYDDAYDIIRPLSPTVYGKEQSSLLPAALLFLAGREGNRALGEKIILTYDTRDSHFTNAMLKYYLDIKDYKKIPRVLLKMKRRGLEIRDEDITVILKSLLQNSLAEGYEYAMLMGDRLPAPAWRIFLQVAVKLEDTPKALWALQHLNGLDENISLDSVTFNTLLKSVLRNQGVDAAYEVYQKFCIRGEVTADMVTWRTLRAAATRHNKPFIRDAMVTAMHRARRSR